MKITIEQAKSITITHILDKLNIQPTSDNQKEAFYLSPLRQEKTASLHVNKVKNLWFDFGIGKGGDGISLVQQYLEFSGEDCTFVDALRWMGNMSGESFNNQPVAVNDLPKQESQPKLILKYVGQIADIRLVRYLESRVIPLKIAKAHLKEVVALNTGSNKKILALGLLNESEGFEISNLIFKSSINGKDISVIRGTDDKPTVLHIYEGKMDFLSSLTRLKTNKIKNDVIVLNSLSMLDRAKDHIGAFSYKTVYSWLDNDNAGDTARQSLDEFLKTVPGIIHKPMNIVYKGYKDVNEWHVANPISNP